MMQFPGVWLEILFFVLTGLLLVLALFFLQNAFRHGGSSTANIVSSGIFVAGVVVILWYGLSLLSNMHWQSTFSIQLPTVHLGNFGL